jgi:hypothetical protein
MCGLPRSPIGHTGEASAEREGSPCLNVLWALTRSNFEMVSHGKCERQQAAATAQKSSQRARLRCVYWS